MHLFLYEWITGGGLVEQAGRLPESLLAEGTAMAAALAEDFAAIDGARVTILRDVRLHEPDVERVRVVEIHDEDERRRNFDRLAAASDVTVVVAPEFDGILAKDVARVREVGGRPLNASGEFIALASCKDRTARRLVAAGVPAPSGRVLEADAARLPADFQFPGVLKPLDGAGSQNMLLVEGPGDLPEPYPWPRRLEQYYPGRPASVAWLCGPAGAWPLPPCWQRLSQDGRFAYRGGATIDEPRLAERATQLSRRALGALPPAAGYVGVDLILGEAPDGGEDVLVEVNPRLTTSYVGLRCAVAENLAQAMLDVAVGRPPSIGVLSDAVEFTSHGAVSKLKPSGVALDTP